MPAMRWLSRLVTVTVILAVVGGAALLFRSKMPKTTTGQGFTTYAKFRDGSRFAVKALFVFRIGRQMGR